MIANFKKKVKVAFMWSNDWLHIVVGEFGFFHGQ